MFSLDVAAETASQVTTGDDAPTQTLTSPDGSVEVTVTVGFRSVVPEDSGFGEFTITSERTEFAFAGDYTSWWIQNNFN